MKKRFPTKKYLYVRNTLMAAFGMKWNPSYKPPQPSVVPRINLPLNKDILIEGDYKLKLFGKDGHEYFTIWSSPEDLRVYELGTMYRTITKRDFYMLHQALTNDLSSIVFQFEL